MPPVPGSPPVVAMNIGSASSVVPASSAVSAVHSVGAPHAAGAVPASAVHDPASGPSAGPRPASSLKEIVRLETERVEREMIVKALEQTGGNVTQAARQLRISRKSLQTKMKELGLREKGQ
ncbi:MAG: hypothetical protein JNJ46_03185 [Myxococcales bacterium]|nr:hypothetical protein [Myxococcales bacterium]